MLIQQQQQQQGGTCDETERWVHKLKNDDKLKLNEVVSKSQITYRVIILRGREGVLFGCNIR